MLLQHLFYFFYSNTSTTNIECFERVLHRTQRYCFYYSLQSIGVSKPFVFFSISNSNKWKIGSAVVRTREIDARRQIYLRFTKLNSVSIGARFHYLLKCFFWEFQIWKINLFGCYWSNLYWNFENLNMNISWCKYKDW